MVGNQAMRILIVEDESKTSAYLAKGLGEQGFVADVAPPGDDGLHFARTQDFDLIVLDVMLPNLDGWSILKAIRSDAPGLRLSSLVKEAMVTPYPEPTFRFNAAGRRQLPQRALGILPCDGPPRPIKKHVNATRQFPNA